MVKRIPDNKQGFAVIQALLLMIVLLIIGIVGWYVFRVNRSNSNQVSDLSGISAPTGTVNPKATTKSSPLPSQTKQHTDNKFKFTLSYPANSQFKINASNQLGESISIIDATSKYGLGIVVNIGGNDNPHNYERRVEYGVKMTGNRPVFSKVSDFTGKRAINQLSGEMEDTIPGYWIGSNFVKGNDYYSASINGLGKPIAESDGAIAFYESIVNSFTFSE